MITAIYARKSTEQNGVRDEEKSVTRQIEHAKAYAAKKGWTVAEDHVYVDDGISGAEFVKRPGFLRLMNALKPRPAFQVLIMSEESRLGREQIETAYALKQIMDAGVRVFFYLEDRERTLDSALDKVMLSLISFASEMEREKAKQRTHDAMLRKAKAGHVTGCKVFGYDNVEVLAEDGRRLHVTRKINEAEAAIVREIFDRFGGGLELKSIAKLLTERRVSPPRGGRKGWCFTALREIIRRELYRGVIVWNRTQAVQRGGTQKQRRRPESDWIRIDAPELRIISEDMWKAVEDRIQQRQRSYLRSSSGQLVGRPSGEDLHSKYLLSGLAKCAQCGGSIVAITRRKGNRERRVYCCAYHRNRGAAVCQNSIEVRQEILDSAVLQALSECLDARLREEAVEQALIKIRTEQVQFPDRRLSIDRELSLIETRIKHLVEAVAQGRGGNSLLDTLEAEEKRKKALVSELADLDGMAQVSRLDGKRLAHDLRAR